jgi:hypothetical protein
VVLVVVLLEGLCGFGSLFMVDLTVFLFVFMYGVCEEFWDLVHILFETLSITELS